MLNKTVLLIMITTILVTTIIIYVRKKTTLNTHLLMALAIGMILYNMILMIFSIEPNFFIAGFVLLLAPLIKSLSMDNIKKILFYYSIGLIFYSILLFVDIIMGLSFLPIYEVRYFKLASDSEELRLAFNCLFGQKNAAGATMSILGMILLHLFYKSNKSMFFLSIGIGIIIFLTNSATGLIMYMIFLVLRFFKILKGYWRYLLLFITFITFITFIMSLFSFDLSSILEDRKVESLIIKLSRIMAFLDLDFQQLVFGNFDGYFYTESSLLDMILNFGIVIPTLLVILLFYFSIQSLLYKDILLAYIFFTYIILITISNSSFLYPNIILLLILTKILNEHKKGQYI
ncbi:hypothetical protein ACN2CX_03260 [Aliarcobacter butzleri]|uniref:hypothetical protein n=1 Tax=Aliarcobacter butzleri TaxID=28197 RepID=UPI003AFA1486